MLNMRAGAIMVWVETTPPEKAEGELKDAYAKVATGRGSVGNIFQAMSLNAKALVDNHALYFGLQFGASPLSRRERELIATVVSRANGCTYCVSHHADAFGRHAREPGLQALVATDYTKAQLSPRERAIADHAHMLTVTPTQASEKAIETLRAAGLTEREIVDVTLVTAYFNFATRVASGLGVSHEDVAAPFKY